MVKRMVVERLKNVDGSPFILKLRKQGQNLNITLEKSSESLSNSTLLFMYSLLLCAASSLIFNGKVVLVLCVIFITSNLYQILTSVQYESLLVVGSLGYQIETRYIYGLNSEFIPMNTVQNSFINEVILRRKVMYLLTLLLKTNKEIKLKPLFSDIKPRLDCLETIYKHLSDLR